jgi:hypothetical protein
MQISGWTVSLGQPKLENPRLWEIISHHAVKKNNNASLYS